jgi:hypothetical protein
MLLRCALVVLGQSKGGFPAAIDVSAMPIGEKQY